MGAHTNYYETTVLTLHARHLCIDYALTTYTMAEYMYQVLYMHAVPITAMKS